MRSLPVTCQCNKPTIIMIGMDQRSIPYRDVSVTLIEDLGCIKLTLKRAEKTFA